MSRYRLAAQAEQDLIEIASYIAENDRSAARAFINEVFDTFERLAEHPGIGHSRRDLTSLPVRFRTVKARYMIIEILRVLSGYRDISAILG